MRALGLLHRMFMNTEMVLVTVISSLLSGMIGVVISFVFYAKLEKRKLKLETAKKLFGSRHDISGNTFKDALNEVMIVFSDSQNVIDKIEAFFNIVTTPIQSRAQGASDEALIKLMKAICDDLKIKYKSLPESYFLKFFSVPSQKT